MAVGTVNPLDHYQRASPKEVLSNCLSLAVWNKESESDDLLLRSVQTETLYNLSSSKNITESLKNFGGGDSDSSFVVAAFGADLEVARGVIR